LNLVGSLSPQVVDRQMRHRHQSAYGSSEALHPLHASLMSLDALLQLSQSPWLANPEKMIHLALQ
jgi:hypothetical protein